MKKKFLFLPIESKVRELDSKTLVAIEAIKNNYIVILGSKSMIRYMRFLPKGFFFYMNSTSVMYNRFKQLNLFGHKIIVHDEEGLAPSDWDDYLRRRIRFQSIKYVDLFFCWGMEQKNNILDSINQTNPNCLVKCVGSPRIDLLKRPIREYNKNEKKNVILINTKFPEINHRLGKHAWINVLKHHNMINNKKELEFRLDQIVYKEKLMKVYIDLIKKISKEFPDNKIILRPHPNEDVNQWFILTRGINNIKVTNKKSIGHWLQNSEIIIHTDCTTAIEGIVLGKPVIGFYPLEDTRFEIPLSKKISMQVNSITKCIEQINSILKGNDNISDNREKVEPLLNKNIESFKGKFSYERIIEEINLFNSIKKTNFTIFNKTKIQIIFKFELLVNLIKLLFGKLNRHTNYNFTKSEIIRSFETLSNKVGYKEKINVIKLSKNIFLIKP